MAPVASAPAPENPPAPVVVPAVSPVAWRNGRCRKGELTKCSSMMACHKMIVKDKLGHRMYLPHELISG